ncbi:hypothetical protein OEZ86_007397 [Tetradesmus obliquus]|nr:hypothetical protein OEZ86_007397 [Tetradesmus obliquus]
MLLPTWALATMYLLMLLYMFVGVALASDKFMASIEVICSATRIAKRKCPVTGQNIEVRVPVWNWVVANVSLMAVGSSAPEILLAVVESVLRLGKPAGELGPSTIVGSAAYNLMMICAVCTVALPTGVVKHVKHLRVFITTAIISMWAYIWMLVVYLWWTPSEITVAEALLTLLQFALLLVIGWAVDVKVWTRFMRGTVANADSDAIVAVEAPALAAASHAMESGMQHVRRSSSLTRDGNTLQPHQPTFNRISSINSTASSQKAGSIKEGAAQQPADSDQQQDSQQQQELWSAWKQQFVDAIEYDSKAVGDGDDDEPGGVTGLLLHFLSIFWKLLSALAPPEWWGGGWPCFCGCLLLIIGEVVIIDEVATLLGCVVGLSPLVIGMSLVALGTSLPDTFCSRTAAVKDDHADAAVGNITGSNAANVFLGLGLPWLISSAYYASKGERFCSDSGALAFSVLVYSSVAVVWLTVLFLRRVYAGGELGAKSAVAKWGLAALAFGLWGLFLVLTGLVSDGGLDDSWIAVRAGACVSSTS